MECKILLGDVTITRKAGVYQGVKPEGSTFRLSVELQKCLDKACALKKDKGLSRVFLYGADFAYIDETGPKFYTVATDEITDISLMSINHKVHIHPALTQGVLLKIEEL